MLFLFIVNFIAVSICGSHIFPFDRYNRNLRFILKFDFLGQSRPPLLLFFLALFPSFLADVLHPLTILQTAASSAIPSQQSIDGGWLSVGRRISLNNSPSIGLIFHQLGQNQIAEHVASSESFAIKSEFRTVVCCGWKCFSIQFSFGTLILTCCNKTSFANFKSTNAPGIYFDFPPCVGGPGKLFVF